MQFLKIEETHMQGLPLDFLKARLSPRSNLCHQKVLRPTISTKDSRCFPRSQIKCLFSPKFHIAMHAYQEAFPKRTPSVHPNAALTTVSNLHHTKAVLLQT
jgi:hypothetical protein